MSTRSQAEAAIRALLQARAHDATICPSEAARSLDATGWRGRMADVHAAVAALVASGEVATTWRGAAVVPGGGPYRIGRRGGGC